MEIIIALVLGLVQGIAEFLPISSSGHLALIQNINKTVFGQGSFTPSLTFDIFLHIATLFSVFVVYKKDVQGLFNALIETIKDIFTGKFKINPEDESKKLLHMLFVTTLFLFPIALVSDFVENAFSSLLIIGIMLFLTGVLTFLTDKVKIGDITQKDVNIKNAWVVGIFQMFAIMPGLSRSGSSIFGGVLSGMKRDFAVKYSFLASIPAILAATLFQIISISKEGMDFNLLPYLVGGLAAFISGIFAIGIVKKLATKYKFKKFSYYCFFISIVTLIIYFRG